MTAYYLRSTDGDDLSDGLSWANAKATLAGIAAVVGAGDVVYVSQAHAESTAAAVSCTFQALPENSVSIYCADDTSGEPPTTLADTASVQTTLGSPITLLRCVYFYGMAFRSGVGTGLGASLSLAASNNSENLVFENCLLEVATTNSGSQMIFGGTATGVQAAVTFKNCDIEFSHVSQYMRLRNCRFKWEGGSVLAGSQISNLVSGGPTTGGSVLTFDSVDFSAMGSGINLVSETGTGYHVATFRNCKLPSGWSGALLVNADVGSRVEMHNCDAGDTNYRLWAEDYFGSIKSETTIVRSGGASDGTTSLSWKMTSSAAAKFPQQPLVSPEIAIWNESEGVAKTLTVEVITDGVTLTDAECWVEVQTLDTSGFPLGSYESDRLVNMLGSASNQDSSSETWTTTGMTSPVKQKLSVTFTPQEKGPIMARVCLAKPSTTVYVDPKLTVS